MNTRASLMLRWTRAALLGLVILATGGIAHVSAAGLLPGTASLMALYSICVVGGAAFLGREASTLRLATLMVIGQAFVHTALSGLAGHQGDPAPSASTEVLTAPPVVVPWDPRSGQSFGEWEQQTFAGSHAPGLALPSWMTHSLTEIATHPVMALTHLLAAVAVGAWLAVGERALWSVLSIATTKVLDAAATISLQWSGLVAVLLAGTRRLPRPEFLLEPLPQLPVWSRGPVLRGPPQLLLAR